MRRGQGGGVRARGWGQSKGVGRGQGGELRARGWGKGKGVLRREGVVVHGHVTALCEGKVLPMPAPHLMDSHFIMSGLLRILSPLRNGGRVPHNER